MPISDIQVHSQPSDDVKDLLLLNVAQRATLEGKNVSFLNKEIKYLGEVLTIKPSKTPDSFCKRVYNKVFKDSKAFIFPIFAQAIFITFLALTYFHLSFAGFCYIKISVDLLMCASIAFMLKFCVPDNIKEHKNADNLKSKFLAYMGSFYLLCVTVIGVLTLGNYLDLKLLLGSHLTQTLNVKYLPYILIAVQVPYLIRGVIGCLNSSIFKYKIKNAETEDEILEIINRKLDLEKIDKEANDKKDKLLKKKIASIEEIIGTTLTTDLLILKAKKLKEKTISENEIPNLKVRINKELNKKIIAEIAKTAVGALAISTLAFQKPLFKESLLMGSNLLSFATMFSPKYRQIPYIPNREPISLNNKKRKKTA